MSVIKIVTDSSAYLSPSVVRQYGIEVIPLRVTLDGRTYQEGIDLSPEQFFQQLERSEQMPTVTAPPVQVIANTYQRLARETDRIISIHVSRRLSDMHDRALQASRTMLGRTQIQVIDSQTISVGLGILAEAAAQAAQEGETVDRIVRMIRGMIPHLYAVFFVEKLEYLERARRIGKAQAILGTMLEIKPMLMVEEGDLIPLEKVRTREQIVDKLHEFIAEFTRIEQLAILQRDFTEETTALLERLEMMFPNREFPVYTYGPSLGVHLGPRAIGVVVYEGL
ncbi:MAG: DegV family protein [Anaerolineae bacterium]